VIENRKNIKNLKSIESDPIVVCSVVNKDCEKTMLTLSEGASFKSSYLNFLCFLEDKVHHSKSINSVLGWSQIYGDVKWRNYDGSYSNEDLEDVVLSKVEPFFNCNFDSYMQNTTVVVVSELNHHGGHSSLLFDWLKVVQNNHFVLITNYISGEAQSLLKKMGVPFLLCQKNGAKKLGEVLSFISKYSRIVLFISPSDIISATAVRICQKHGAYIIFVNHADHAFSYGISFADKVCEISAYGMELNRENRQVVSQAWLGIPIVSNSVETKSNMEQSLKEYKCIVTCGAFYKYQPGHVFFGEFLDRLLYTEEKVQIHIVGSTGREEWWKKYVDSATWKGRVCFHGVLGRKEYLSLMSIADVYVDSFPITGGIAFAEAVINGVPSVAMDSALCGYSPADKLRVQNIDNLVRVCIRALKREKGFMNKFDNVRKECIRYHSLELFSDNISKVYHRKSECLNKGQRYGRFLENRWEKDSIIYLPFSPSMRNISLIDTLAFFYFLRNIKKYIKVSHVLYFFISVLKR